MSKPVNKTVIGIFMVSAVALLVAAVVILGSGKFLKTRPKYVMFFEGSVQGLSVGSPVVFRGVRVGEVSDIKISYNPKSLAVRIPVVVELGEGKIEAEGGGALKPMGNESEWEFAKKMIARGIRAQLAMQSFVTGQLMITLDFYPGKPVNLVGTDKRYPEIPTIPTPLQELTRKLEKLPIEDILNKVNEAMTAITKIVSSPETVAMLRSVSAGVDETRVLVKNVNNHVGPAGKSINEAAEQFKKLADRLEKDIGPLMASLTKASDEAGTALNKSQALMSGDSPMGYRLMKALDEFEAAARSVRALADTLDQHPEVLLYGKKNKEAAK